MSTVSIVSQGSIKTSVTEMNVGDYIAARYVTTAMTTPGTFSELGTVDTSTVANFSSTQLDGVVYFMKVAKGVLMCTTLTCSGVTYSVMNKLNLIYGSKVTLASKDFLLRVPNTSEFTSANSTMNGMVSTDDRYTNFGTAAGTKEIIQENYCLTPGYYTWNTTPGDTTNYASGDNSRFARMVLVYPEDSKCTDLYH